MMHRVSYYKTNKLHGNVYCQKNMIKYTVYKVLKHEHYPALWHWSHNFSKCHCVAESELYRIKFFDCVFSSSLQICTAHKRPNAPK